MSIYIGEPVEVSDYSAMQGPCSDGFHVPLQSEWSGLYTIMSGLSLTTGNNWVTNLHLPFAGRRQYNGTSYVGRGTFGNYRSSSYDSSSAYALVFDSSINYNASIITSFSLSIRPFKNSFVAPTSGWTVITGTLGGAGIFWNQTDGIISITSDGTTGYTIADKNLGATYVYNDGDTLSESNCGYNYQRGNNYGFPFNASVTKSSTQVNASNYGPGNYYSSSTFITGGNNWDSSNNANLRGGETGVVQKPEYQEVQNIYIGEYGGEPITTAGIYWNETQGLISLSSNGSTWITIADKNLGATQVYNYGDTLSEANCGKWYQWGNNYGFSYSGTPSSSTTQLDISSYGPNNYLNSSTFRKIPSGSDSGWRPYTPSNYAAVKNLWGGYTDTLVARRGPCDEGWHIPSYTEANNINTMLLSIFGISSFNSIKTDVITYLKRPAAGTLNGFLTGIDGPGNYLKTMISDYYNGSNSNYYCFEILLPYTSSSFVSINSGSYASTIRPFKNESVQPTSKWTKLY